MNQQVMNIDCRINYFIAFLTQNHDFKALITVKGQI